MEHQVLLGDVYASPILVCCGRGLQDREGFELAIRVAEVLGGQIVGTRAAVDKGWIDHHRELGLSGLRTAPELYLGCGVSGTNFHTIGMRQAKHIAAISTDPLARIFALAEVCVLRDAKETLRELLAEAEAHGPFADPAETIAWVLAFLGARSSHVEAIAQNANSL